MGEELKLFLSHRRAQIAPASVGLNGGRTRRKPGLTREDMAELVGVSFRWYTQFESGAAKAVSRKFAERVAAVLKLSAAERHYLWALLGFGEDTPPANSAPTAALSRLLHAPHGMAMALYSPLFDVVEANAGYLSMFPAPTADTRFARNKLWRIFFDPAFRAAWVDWDSVARRVVADFRFMSAHLKDGDDYKTLVDELRASPEFVEFWSSNSVTAMGAEGTTFTLTLPSGTVERIDVTVLRSTDCQSLYLAVLMPELST
jgi:transcriptional regulator with XRE-family HTH domain